MPASVSDDLRSKKTEKALYAAMFSLLKKSSFRKITIKGICEEALISRAAFYAHFIDKYDLLTHWMSALWPKEIVSGQAYELVEKAVNEHVYEHAAIFKNLVNDADHETFTVLYGFLLTTIGQAGEPGGDQHPKNVVLANFYAGGMISYLLWQIKHRFPSDVPMMNSYLYDIIRELLNWHGK